MESDIFRTEGCIERYRERRREIESGLIQIELKDLLFVNKWKHWILVENEFPYDKIAEYHCLLVPFRRFAEDEEMHEDERLELSQIKNIFSETKDFDVILESLRHDRTVPETYHLHCMKLRYRTPISEL